MKSTEVSGMVSAFSEATTITANFVSLPVLFLVVGFLIDRTLSTTPLFIFLGIIIGVSLGIYRAVKISKNYKFTKTSKK